MRKKSAERFRLGRTKKKILLLLSAGLALCLTRRPDNYFKIVKEAAIEWKDIERHCLREAIKSLYRSKLVSTKYNRDGTTTLILSDEGKKVALTYNTESMRVKRPLKWDKKWRMVMFDIPEKRKMHREELRMQLKQLGFVEFQKSAFVIPWDCRSEINFVVENLYLRKFVRYAVVESVDNELDLMKYFELL